MSDGGTLTETMDSNTAEHRPKGRPQSEETRRAILHAALALAEERGYHNVTMLDIAARAGTGRQAIYRRWPSITDLYIEVIVDQIHAISTPQFLAADLETYLTYAFAFMRGPAGKIAVGLLSDSQSERVAQVFRPLLAMRLKLLTGVVEHFAAEHHRDFSVSPALIAEALAGSMWYRALHQSAPLDDAFAAQLTTMAAALLKP